MVNISTRNFPAGVIAAVMTYIHNKQIDRVTPSIPQTISLRGDTYDVSLNADEGVIAIIYRPGERRRNELLARQQTLTGEKGRLEGKQAVNVAPDRIDTETRTKDKQAAVDRYQQISVELEAIRLELEYSDEGEIIKIPYAELVKTHRWAVAPEGSDSAGLRMYLDEPATTEPNQKGNPENDRRISALLNSYVQQLVDLCSDNEPFETDEDIARACHEANRFYCQAMGDSSQQPWDEAPEWQRTSALKGVEYHLSNPDSTPEDSHKSWLAEKVADGWVCGPIKDADKKEHPCCVPHSELPIDQQLKDVLFLGIVRKLEAIRASSNSEPNDLEPDEKGDPGASDVERTASAAVEVLMGGPARHGRVTGITEPPEKDVKGVGVSEFDGMTKAELEALAKKAGLKLAGREKKDDLLIALKEAAE